MKERFICNSKINEDFNRGDFVEVVLYDSSEVVVKKACGTMLSLNPDDFSQHFNEVPNLIGRSNVGFSIVGVKQYSWHRDDCHLHVVIARRSNRDGTQSWCTWLYNASTDSFHNGNYDMTYNEAMLDFSERGRTMPPEVEAAQAHIN